MNISTMREQFFLDLERYDASMLAMKHCMAAYEIKFCDLIGRIAKCNSFELADEIFDIICVLHGDVSSLVFLRDFTVNDRMMDLVAEFDRLDDPYIRKYWYEKFRSGEAWPIKIDMPTSTE